MRLASRLPALGGLTLLVLAALGGSAGAVEAAASATGHNFVSQFSIFLLAVFVGYYVVWT